MLGDQPLVVGVALVGGEVGHLRCVAALRLPRLLELKIASGMTAPHRMRVLDDAMRLIAANELDEAYAEELDPYVRDKYLELWKLAQIEEDY